MIKDNIACIKDDISLICRRLGKNPSEISLVCVTKAASLKMIWQALQNGITDIGENRVQDAQKKFVKLQQLIDESHKNYPIKYHMIGHMQTNKVKLAISIFDLIHSLDSLHLAEEIEKQAENLNKRVDCLVEVNTSGEPSKFGINPEEAEELIAGISKLKRISIQGLMTIAPETEDENKIRPCFRELRLLKEKIANEFSFPNVHMKYLSMGMTNDYRIALEEGSNMLRIGRAVFANE